MTNDKGHTFLAFLLGGVVGAGIALLYAPASGAETRKRIKEGVSGARDMAEEKLDEAKEKLDEVKETLAEGAGKVKKMFEDKKAEVTAAYEAGREAFIKEHKRNTI